MAKDEMRKPHEPYEPIYLTRPEINMLTQDEIAKLKEEWTKEHEEMLKAEEIRRLKLKWEEEYDKDAFDYRRNIGLYDDEDHEAY